jgi:hypothetical protein
MNNGRMKDETGKVEIRKEKVEIQNRARAEG